MSNILSSEYLSQLPFLIIALVIAFTLHEFAHAYVAYKFGDPTAKNQGRLTLNPMSHLDPFGTIMILIFGFGWARPVEINRHYFKKPRLAETLVTLAGPMANLLVAFVGLILWQIGLETGIIRALPPMGMSFLYDLFQTIISLNILLFVFNLIPLPPLDGFHIVMNLVPGRWRMKLMGIQQYGGLIFLVLVLVEPLNRITIQPLFYFFIPAVSEFLSGIVGFLFGY